jgi:hypothetical protein
MAATALAFYAGERLIYAGEWLGGCAEPTFFATLNAQFALIDEVALPRWFMRDDRLMVFKRRTSPR